MCLPFPHAHFGLQEAQDKQLEPVTPNIILSRDLNWPEPHMQRPVCAPGLVARRRPTCRGPFPSLGLFLYNEYVRLDQLRSPFLP